MLTNPEQQPQKTGGNGGWLALGALVLGYVLGQSSGTSSNEQAYGETPTATLGTTVEDADDNATAAIQTELAEANEEALSLTPEEDSETSKTDDPTGEQVATAYYTEPTKTADETRFAETSDGIGSPDDAIAAAAISGTAATVATGGPWTRYQSASNASSYPTPAYNYSPPTGSYAAPKCEGVGCYGAISETTGLPRTTYVKGYFRKDGTYVQPHYRSRRRN